MEWIEQFIKLYTSEIHDDFNQALKLKQKNIPPKLYRYRSVTDNNIPHRINEIVCGELFLSHPKELNDPFEVCSMLHSDKPDHYLNAKEIHKVLFRDKMPSCEFENIFGKEDYFEELALYVARKSTSPEKAEDLKKALIQAPMCEIETLKSNIDDLFRSMIRIACFSTTAKNLPMWHHYTNGHTGICLEFDTSRITDVLQTNKLFPVNYVTNLPDMTHMISKNKCSNFSAPTFQAMHKLKDWSYENEWRLIYDAGSFYDSSNDIPGEFWSKGKAIEFIKPSRVILGINMSIDHQEIICKFARQCNIPVTKAELTAFGIKTE